MAKKRDNSFFGLIHDALKEGVETLERGGKLTVRDVTLPDPPRSMSAQEIVALRVGKLRVSQRVFAGLLNASPTTVHAWEQGRKKPSGIALRLLRVVQSNPGVLIPVRVRPTARPGRGSSGKRRVHTLAS